MRALRRIFEAGVWFLVLVLLHHGRVERQKPSVMEVDPDPAPCFLSWLPYPVGWQVVCTFLTTPEVLRLSTTCQSYLEIASGTIQDLTIREGLGSASVSLHVLRRCDHVTRLRLVGLGSHGAWKLQALEEQTPHAFRSLVTLDLAGNMMGEVGMAALLPCLEVAPSLRMLILDTNALGNSGARVLRRGLERGLLSSLKALSLAFNAVGSMGVWELAQALRAGAGAELEYLNLDCNILGPAGTVELAGAFRVGACARLRQLYLRNNDVQGQGLRELLAAFSAGACSRLEGLHLDSNMMGTLGARLLAHALSGGACSELQVLSLNATFIGEGSRELAGAFRRGACKQLQELYLRNVYLKDSGVHDLVTAFQTGAVGGTLQVLNLDFNHIGPQGSAVLADFFRSGAMQCLQELHMASMSLNQHSFRVLAEALRTNAGGSLRLLSLDSNGLGEAGARLLAELLVSWHAPQLSHLSLQNNQLSDKGVELVCGALEAGTCPSLQVMLLTTQHGTGRVVDHVLQQCLRLDSNLVGEAGAQALAGAFKSKAFPSLRRLHLGHNLLQNQGVYQLLLHAHQSELEVLQLEENRVSDEGMLAMASLLERGWCGKLRELHLKNNFFQHGDTAMVVIEAFCAAARRNGVTPQVLSLGMEDNLLGEGPHARRYSWG